MGKQPHFYYDPDSLSYREVTHTKSKKYLRTFGFILSSAITGFLLFLLANQAEYIRTPEEIRLGYENENYKQDYELLKERSTRIEQAVENLRKRDAEIYRRIFEMDPISEENFYAGFGGVNRYEKYQGYENSDLIEETVKKVELLEKAISVHSKSLDDIKDNALRKEELLKAIPAIQPIKNEDLRRMASGYGYRTDPFTKVRKFHDGMDFSARTGTPIYATGDGKVTRRDSRAAGYGNHIRIDHGYGYITLYAHLSKYNVRRGQRVRRGDIIGFVGNTGRSRGPHLHYEVRKNGRAINPLNFYAGTLSAKDYEKLRNRAEVANEALD